jgi:uncharacterized protein
MLLMIDPPTRAPQPTRRVTVPAGTAGAIEVLQGQLLKITALEAGAVASLFGFAASDPGVYLSVHHTRVFSNTYLLGAGMRLVSNRRRPLMVLGIDTVGTHDLLLPASTTAELRERGLVGEQGCADAVARVMAERGIAAPKLPDPVNLFMNVGLHTDGRIEPLPSTVKPGDHVVCRVVRDCTFIVSACRTGIPGNDTPGALELAVAEDLADF